MAVKKLKIGNETLEIRKSETGGIDIRQHLKLKSGTNIYEGHIHTISPEMAKKLSAYLIENI